MSKYTLTRRKSAIGSTFRILMCSDDTKRSLYITKSTKTGFKYKMYYNIEGKIRVMHSNGSAFHNYFKKKFVVSGTDTKSKALNIYEKMVRKAHENIRETGEYAIDGVFNGFRVKSWNYMEVQIADIERQLNCNSFALNKKA